MARKKHPRSQAVRTPDRQFVPSWEPHLGDQSENTHEQAAHAAPPSSTHSRSEHSSPNLPKNVVKVRYLKGKDRLLVEDKISHQEITLDPGDHRTVHMTKALMQTLTSQGFELEVVM